MALNLAQALLRVWEGTAKMATLGKSLAPSDKPNFDTTGLTLEDSNDEASLDLTEKRVNRLIEFGSLTKAKQADHFATEESSWGSKVKIGGFITGGFTLWLLMLEAIHLLMMPMGCVLIF